MAKKTILRPITPEHLSGMVFGLCAAALGGAGMVFVSFFEQQGLPIGIVTLLTFFYSGLLFLAVGLVWGINRGSTIRQFLLNKHFWAVSLLTPWFLFFFYRAVRYVPASIAETLTTLGPVVTYLVLIFGYRKKISKQALLASFLMMGAVYLLVFGFAYPKFSAFENIGNALLTVAIGLVIAAFAKASQKEIPLSTEKGRKGQGVLFVGLYFLVASVAILPATNLTGWSEFGGLSAASHLLLLLSSWREGLVWFFVFLAIRRIGAYHANVLQNLTFLFTIVFDFVFFGTVLCFSEYTGISIIALTLLIIARDLARTPESTPPVRGEKTHHIKTTV